MADEKLSSFESSLDRLQAIVTELESGQVDLARSVDLYDEGRKLIENCEKLLVVAEERLKLSSTATRGDASRTVNLAAGHTELSSLDEEIPF